MSVMGQVAALVGCGAFLYGLGRAAWSGQDSRGRWVPGGRRWLLVAGVGFGLLALGLRGAGVESTGLHYPPAIGDGE